MCVCVCVCRGGGRGVYECGGRGFKKNTHNQHNRTETDNYLQVVIW